VRGGADHVQGEALVELTSKEATRNRVRRIA
jgi:hypothetical protein